jgi:hypothetical protein
VLASIRVLLAEPNPDDGLMADIVRSPPSMPYRRVLASLLQLHSAV